MTFLMKIGSYSISSILVDRFRLDGGAMFGTVPKPLWSKRIAADELNRIQLASRVLLIENGSQKILIDVGCGRKWDLKQQEIFKFEPLLKPALEVQHPDVTDIILTHLHFDHAGGITRWDEQGKAVLSFPAARIYLQERNWERAQNPGLRERASYLSPNVEPLKQAQLTLTKDDQEIFPGISLHRSNGHTDGLQWVLIRSGSEALAYPADLVPTAHHLPVPWVMSYDLSAEISMREKELFLSQAVMDNWWIVFEHDAETAAVRVERDKRGNYAAAATSRIEQL